MQPFQVTRNGGNGRTYRQTRNGDLRIPTRGVRLPAGATAWLDDVRAMALVLPEAACFSHTCAAHLLGLPLPTNDPRPLHVTVPVGTCRGRRKGIVWHRADLTGDLLVIDGLPVTDVARTWRDVGSMLELADLVAITDHLLRRGMAKADELLVPRGCRRAPTLRRALSLADPRSRSPRESALRVGMHDAGLPTPEINKDIVEDGGWLATGDFVWSEFRLIIEYDGGHHASLKQRHQDAVTRDALREHGWDVRVLTAIHMRRSERAVALVADALRSHGWIG